MILKYVIFVANLKVPQFMPVLVPDHVPHSMIRLDEPALIFSAGFAKLSGYNWEISKSPSVSLSLGPSRYDRDLLLNASGGRSVTAFLCADYLSQTALTRVQRHLIRLAEISIGANKPTNLTAAALAKLAETDAAKQIRADELAQFEKLIALRRTKTQ